VVLRVTGALERYPARAAFVSFSLTILLGAFVLTLPMCRNAERELVAFVDALFTATSALCVTGLTVRSTGNDFNFIGQAVILFLIQVGGIGIVTITTFVTLRLVGGDTMRQRVAAAEAVGGTPTGDVGSLLAKVLAIVLAIELTGAALLLVRNLFVDASQPRETVWSALFHSIAAFCNAGFSLYDDNLTRYRRDPLVNLVITSLIISGGLGFPVLVDLGRWVRRRWQGEHHRLSLHTRLMLLGTATLLVGGTLITVALEWYNTLGGEPVAVKVLAAFFHSTACRTAGFNTLPIGQFHEATLWISIILMAIGAGPCSTAGGFKVSTMAILVLVAWRRLLGSEQVHAFRRSVPPETINKAIATALLFAVVGMTVLTLVLMAETETSAAKLTVVSESSPEAPEQRATFLPLFFETISALGTVGLSTGDHTGTVSLSGDLEDESKLFLVLAMLVGRLGPISFFIALSRLATRQELEYPKENVLIG
jgi:trk system potassium uptake protein TrkH